MIGRATSQSGTDLVLMTDTRGGSLLQALYCSIAGSVLLTSEGLFVAELSVPAAVFLDQETLMFDAFMAKAQAAEFCTVVP